jgi:hypothetical protein
MKEIGSMSARSAISFVCVTVVCLSGCHRDRNSATSSGGLESGSTSVALAGGTAGAGNDALKVQAARPDPCGFLPIDDAKRLLGPLSGQPWRSVSVDDETPKPDGPACIYPLVPRQNVGEQSVIALELKTDGALGFENGVAFVGGAGNGFLGKLGIKNADGAQHNVDGWDYIGGFTDIMTARVGHLAIAARWTRARGAADSLVEVMTIMRDHIPDLPFAAPTKGSSRDDGDACALLTRGEAEAVLGTLTVEPYRSLNLTGLADEHGDACSYFTKRHHVLSIEPTWSQGKTLFRMTAGLTQGTQSKVKVAGESADTLEGPWDQAGANLGGDLYFLKGDRMLAISYRASATDKAGAVKLASIALKRLVAAP